VSKAARSPQFPNLLRKYVIRNPGPDATYWWGRTSDATIPLQYLEAARRLSPGGSFDAEDSEQVLLPVVYLYRHAIELQAKKAVAAASALRLRLDPENESLHPMKVESELKAQSHNLVRTVRSLTEHLRVLEFGELAPEMIRFLRLVGESDIDGTTFRYSGRMPSAMRDKHGLDLRKLGADLEGAYWYLGGAIDQLGEAAELYDDWDGFLAPYMAEVGEQPALRSSASETCE